ncbi:MAG TPA: hypothetical protein VEI53_02930 [Ktedonobacteraceae bacterium]|nr:hypothetical protein [Ktedonobacteraceae bacterium]
MSLSATNQETLQPFSELVDYFMRRYCRVGDDLSVLDRELFPEFRTFWKATALDRQHPALLGQFRVELTERGFKSRGRKRVRWYGITLHKLTVLAEKE